MLRYRAARPDRVAHWPADQIQRLDRALLGISIITLAEARFGWVKSKASAKFIAHELQRLSNFVQLPIDPDVLEIWALLKAAVTADGISIADNDLWIGATAKARGATVVTADTDFLSLAGHVDLLYLLRKPDSHPG